MEAPGGPLQDDSQNTLPVTQDKDILSKSVSRSGAGGSLSEIGSFFSTQEMCKGTQGTDEVKTVIEIQLRHETKTHLQ